MKLHGFTSEIMAIAEENGVTWDVGKDMFLTNIANACDADRPHYAGADHVEYIDLKAHHTELADSSADFVADYQENQSELARLWETGDTAGINMLMAGALQPEDMRAE